MKRRVIGRDEDGMEIYSDEYEDAPPKVAPPISPLIQGKDIAPVLHYKVNAGFVDQYTPRPRGNPLDSKTRSKLYRLRKGDDYRRAHALYERQRRAKGK